MENTAGSPLVVTRPAGLQLNDLLVVQLSSMANVGWQQDPGAWVMIGLLYTADAGNNRNQCILATRSTGLDSGAVQNFPNSGAIGTKYGTIHAFRNVAPGATPWESFSGESGLSATVPDRIVTTAAGAPRLALNLSVAAMCEAAAVYTGAGGGTWALLASGVYCPGNAVACALQSAPMPVAGSIDGGTYTHPTASPYNVVGFALVGM
jgi:hypothetical protein